MGPFEGGCSHGHVKRQREREGDRDRETWRKKERVRDEGAKSERKSLMQRKRPRPKDICVDGEVEMRLAEGRCQSKLIPAPPLTGAGRCIAFYDITAVC